MEGTASLCTVPVAFFFFFLINSLIYCFGAKAKAYGNQLFFPHWIVGNESLCTGVGEPTVLPDDLHRGHVVILVTATSQNTMMQMCGHIDKLTDY